MMRSSAYNRFGVLMGTSWPASCPRWYGLREDSLPMITLFPSQGDFYATADGLLPLCLAASQLTSTAGNTQTYAWDGDSQAVETHHSCHGSRHDRSCVDNNRVVILSGTSSILGSIVQDQALVCLAG